MKKLKTTTQVHEQMVQDYEKLTNSSYKKQYSNNNNANNTNQ